MHPAILIVGASRRREPLGHPGSAAFRTDPGHHAPLRAVRLRQIIQPPALARPGRGTPHPGAGEHGFLPSGVGIRQTGRPGNHRAHVGRPRLHPQVWNQWLADREGILAAAEMDGKAVGFGKLTRLASGEWWIEGLRVHPDYQGLKIGSQLFEYLLDQWKERGSGVIRLATSSERVQVHHLCDRLGFRRVESVPSHGRRADGSRGVRLRIDRRSGCGRRVRSLRKRKPPPGTDPGW